MSDTVARGPLPSGQGPPDVEAELEAARASIARLGEQLEQARAASRRLVERLEQRNQAIARANDTIARLEERLADERYRRIRRTAEDHGVADYLLTPDEDGGRPIVPGYARKPSFLPLRRRFVDGLVERRWVRPADRVLDIGCGIGAVAAYLVAVLGDQGSYVGLDVDGAAIAEARRHFGGRPNFSFAVMDVFSGKYNPQGRHQPQEYRVPFDDGSFDLVIMRSLFTHMLPDDVDHYLAEVARVLGPGGRAAVTFFLLDAAGEAAVAAGSAIREFAYRGDGYRLDDVDVVEAAVAIDLTWVKDALARHGFDISAIEEGTWRFGGGGTEQDTVYVVRR